MNRRTFLTGLMGLAGLFCLPAGVALTAEQGFRKPQAGGSNPSTSSSEGISAEDRAIAEMAEMVNGPLPEINERKFAEAYAKAVPEPMEFRSAKVIGRRSGKIALESVFFERDVFVNGTLVKGGTEILLHEGKPIAYFDGALYPPGAWRA